MPNMKKQHLVLNLLTYALGFLMMFAISSCGEDEEPPIVINVSDFTVTIPENPTAGQNLGTISASTNRGTLTFAMASSASFDGAFAVNPATGTLTVANPAYFDFEVNPVVTGSVVVSNGPVSETVSVTVNLTDVNEITVSVSDFSITIPENPADGAVLGTITATTNMGSVSFSLSNQTPAGALAIHPTSGQLTVNDRRKFNYELYRTITATVTATNSGVSAMGSVTITLTDVAETVQQRLDDGETPKQIYDSNNNLLSDLYGKNYGGGFIVIFNPTTGNGFVLSDEIPGGTVNYITAQSRANSYNGGGFTNWRIPVQSDIDAINALLNSNNAFLPPTNAAWASGTCCGGGGGLYYYIATSGVGYGYSPTNSLLPVRAIRPF